MKYKKWRELELDPFNINFKKIKIKKITGYMPAGNDVIEVLLDNNTYAYIKIERSKIACFDTEVKNISIIKNNNYYSLIPDVLEFLKEKQKDILVLKKIDGKKLSEIFSKMDNKLLKQKYLYKYGKELANIHNIPCGDFGIAKQRIINEKPTNDIYGTFDKKIAKYIKYLEENDFEKEKTTFIHGDFHYGNILWKNSRINGIIDYEYSGKGLKEQDIAWALILRPGQIFMDYKEDLNSFLEGYKSNGSYNEKKLKWCLINGYCHFYLMNKNNKTYQKKIISLLETII